MQRIQSVDPHAATGRTRELYGAVAAAFGGVPNVARVMGNSPAVLNSYLQFTAALGESEFDQTFRNKIALAASQANECDYCVNILSDLTSKAGVGADEILGVRKGEAGDQKTDAALKFAKALVREHGKVSDAELARVRKAGFTDKQITEIAATVIYGVFTNYLNNLADTEHDFPRQPKLEAA